MNEGAVVMSVLLLRNVAGNTMKQTSSPVGRESWEMGRGGEKGGREKKKEEERRGS